jgi:uncharacterized membrane protein YccC
LHGVLAAAMSGLWKRGMNMATILYAIATWVLLQLLFVWFCARLAAVREFDVKDYLELQAYLVRTGLDRSEHEAEQLSLPVAPTRRQLPPAGIARA